MLLVVVLLLLLLLKSRRCGHDDRGRSHRKRRRRRCGDDHWGRERNSHGTSRRRRSGSGSDREEDARREHETLTTGLSFQGIADGIAGGLLSGGDSTACMASTKVGCKGVATSGQLSVHCTVERRIAYCLAYPWPQVVQIQGFWCTFRCSTRLGMERGGG